MAIVTGPLHSSEARGAVGGLVYNTHRGRAYVKANVTPATQYSAEQIASRAVMVDVIGQWQSITDAQRADWHHFATMHPLPSWTGSDKRISGWNWFAKVNYRLAYMGEGMLDNPPNQITGFIFSGTITRTGPLKFDITWTAASPAPDPAWSFWFRKVGPHSTGAHPSIKLAKLTIIGFEQTAEQTFSVATIGAYTVYVTPVSLQGIEMPPTALTIVLT